MATRVAKEECNAMLQRLVLGAGVVGNGILVVWSGRWVCVPAATREHDAAAITPGTAESTSAHQTPALLRPPW